MSGMPWEIAHKDIERLFEISDKIKLNIERCINIGEKELALEYLNHFKKIINILDKVLLVVANSKCI